MKLCLAVDAAYYHCGNFFLILCNFPPKLRVYRIFSKNCGENNVSKMALRCRLSLCVLKRVWGLQPFSAEALTANFLFCCFYPLQWVPLFYIRDFDFVLTLLFAATSAFLSGLLSWQVSCEKVLLYPCRANLFESMVNQEHSISFALTKIFSRSCQYSSNISGGLVTVIPTFYSWVEEVH